MSYYMERVAELLARGLEPHVIRERLGLTNGAYQRYAKAYRDSVKAKEE